MKLIIGAVVGIIFIGLLQVFIGIFLTERRSIELLDKLGFQNIHLLNKSSLYVQFRGCGEMDITKFTLSAEDVHGKNVILTTCEGLFKYATLRN